MTKMMTFNELVKNEPGCIEKPLHNQHELGFMKSGWGPDIDDTALFATTVRLGSVAKIGADVRVRSEAQIAESVWLGKDVVVREEVHIGSGTYIDEGAVIGRSFKLGDGVFIGKGAKLGPRFSDHEATCRKIDDDVTIGDNVAIHSEANIGEGAIIPNSDTIAWVGRFGMQQRRVTVYGSEHGARFGVGCSRGITAFDFKTMATNGGKSDYQEDPLKSTSDYLRNWGVIMAAAEQVQAAYEASGDQVAELMERRRELMAPLSLHGEETVAGEIPLP